MTRIGPNAKLTVAETERTKVRTFYAEILGLERVEPRPDMDLFRTRDGYSLGVQYVSDADALGTPNGKKGAWLELVVDDPAEVVARVRPLGIEPFEYVDKGHVYLQAPGGQVFRLARSADRR